MRCRGAAAAAGAAGVLSVVSTLTSLGSGTFVESAEAAVGIVCVPLGAWAVASLAVAMPHCPFAQPPPDLTVLASTTLAAKAPKQTTTLRIVHLFILSSFRSTNKTETESPDFANGAKLARGADCSGRPMNVNQLDYSPHIQR